MDCARSFEEGCVFGDSDGIYNSFGGRSAYNFEGNWVESSVMVGAVFVTGSFANGMGELGGS